MAARSIASLLVSFGMVSIPVKLYAATQASAGISFNLLHRACGSRLRQQYVCIKEDVVVERADMTKGYAVSQNKSPAEMGMKPPSAGAVAPTHLLFAELEGNGHYYGSDAKRSPLDKYRSPGSPAYTGD